MATLTAQPSFRALQLIGNLEIGGAQEVVRTLSANLNVRGCPTVVCSFRDGPLRKQIEAMGIPVEILPGRTASIVSPARFSREMAALRRRLAELVERYQANVLQTHLLRSMDFLAASLKWSFPRLMVFWTVHNYQFELRADQLSQHAWLLNPKNKAHNLLYRAGAGKVNGFIAVSDEVERAILHTIAPRKERITTIWNGVDTSRYHQQVDRAAVRAGLGLSPADRIAIVVGTLKEQKGHCYLVEAAAPLVAQHRDLHLLFAGDGALREPLERQVREAGLAGNIHFLGSRTDIPELLSASDYFVLPSLWEGLPMALIEAMASGLPVLATQVSGSLQVVTPGETGLLVPPGEVQPLRSALADMIADPERAHRMGQAGSVRVEALYGAGKQAEEHLALYRREWRKVAGED